MSDQNPMYCLRCGDRLSEGEVQGRKRRTCPACGFVLYRNPVGASAGLLLNGDEVLLVQRGIEPFKGSWAIPAGYQDEGESPAEAAEREVEEETGVTVNACLLLDLLYVPDDPRKPANVALFACQQTGGILQAADDAMDAAWFSLSELPEEIAFDNRRQVFDRLAPGGDLRKRLDLIGGNQALGFVD